MPVPSYLVDTNILLRLVQPDSREYGTVRQCLDQLWARGTGLFYTSQILAEFWNVCTRPADRNGFGFSVAETAERAAWIEDKLTFVVDSAATHLKWREIVIADNVCGVQVHDARLVAAMRVHGIENLFTLNVRDFRRYRDINVLSPEDVLDSIR